MIDHLFIDSNCLTTKGGLNNRVCLKSWWDNRNLSDIYMSIFEVTPFLSENSSLSERLYCIKYNITSLVKCQQCKVKSVTFKGYSDGYHLNCSIVCSGKSLDRIQKIIKNTDYIARQETYVNTIESKYGRKHYFQTEDAKKQIRKSKMIRYGDEKYNNPEKSKKTNLLKYGVEYSCIAEQVKDKSRNTIESRTPELFNANWLTTTNKTKTLTEISEQLGVTYRTVWLAFERLNLNPIFYNPKYNKIENYMGVVMIYGHTSEKKRTQFLASSYN